MTATLDRPASVAVAPTWRDRLQPSVTGSGGWLVTAFVTLVAGVLRFVRLDLPATSYVVDGVTKQTVGPVGPGKIFDEIYYACDAQNLLRYGVEHATYSAPDPATAAQAVKGMSCVVEPGSGGAFVVHPPLGKWAIAVGEQLFGVNTFGWRSMAAVAGTLTVLLVVRTGRRMTGSTLLGGVAGLLLALDGLSFVQSRTSMLDIFLALWVVAAFSCLVVDRDHLRRRLSRATQEDVEAGGGRLLGRPWRVAAGVCAGAALGTKWSALYFLAVLVVLAVVWEVGARRTAGVRAPSRVTLRRSSVPVLATFVLLPAVLYVASWAGWFASDIGWDRHWAETHPASFPLVPDVWRSFVHYHVEIYDFHNTLSARHPYQSHPLSWLVLGRPVSYYYPAGTNAGVYGCAAVQCSREVLAIGTPALWWAMVPACLGLAAMWVAQRDWRASSLLAMFAVGILAWIPSDLKGRTMFLFYALPSVPFICLGMALLAGWALGHAGTVRRTVASVSTGVYVSLVLVNFAWLYPVLAAVTIPYASWRHRMWFGSWI